MTLRNRALLLVFLSLTAIMGLVYFFSSQILFKGFLRVEHSWAVENVKRVNEALDNMVETLRLKSADWGIWDDTYKYIEDHNPEYAVSNLGIVTFENMQINQMLYINVRDEVVHQKAYDFLHKKDIEFSKDFLNFFTPGSDLLKYKALEDIHSGVLSASEGPILFAARPILTSKKEGPSRGTLVFGRYLDQGAVDQLSKITKMELKIYPLNNVRALNEVQEQYQHLSTNRRIYISIKDKDDLEGFLLVNDVFDKPALLIRADMKRDIFAQAIFTDRSLILFLSIANISFLILFFLLLDRFFIRRIITLTHNVQEIGNQASQQQVVHSRVKVKGMDEVSKVASTINIMLDRINDVQKNLKTSEEKFRVLADTVPVLIWMSVPDKSFSYFNKTWLDFRGRPMEEEMGEGWFEGIHKEDSKRVVNFYKIFFDQRKPFVNEFRLRRYDGKYRWIMNSGIPRLDPDGNFLGYIGSCLDITERKELEDNIINGAKIEQMSLMSEKQKSEELKAANEQIRQRTKELEIFQEKLQKAKYETEGATRAKGESLILISKKILIPLNAILESLQFMQKTTLSDQQKAQVELIVTNSRTLLSIVNDILALSQDITSITTDLKKGEKESK